MLKSTVVSAAAPGAPALDEDRVSWAASIPFFAIHAACLAAFFVGFKWWYPLVALGLYYLRMFGITAGYHRYFSHRSYKTSRLFQLLLALLGTSATQKGVLWWAAHHRDHHKYSDLPEDIHSPVQRGLWWSHVGWILSSRYDRTKTERIQDFAKYPELRWLNRWYVLPPIALGFGLWLAGGWGLLVWGYFISTTLLYHGTFTINSLSHMFGRRRYQTTDDSRNNWALALITMGEGWHNNHHYYQSSANQGFFWWEVDMSYYLLRLLSYLGLVWDLRTPPRHVRDAHLAPAQPAAPTPPAPVPLKHAA
jgi:stearoyl-CoA desaturase (delta-9 desaturase)